MTCMSDSPTPQDIRQSNTLAYCFEQASIWTSAPQLALVQIPRILLWQCCRNGLLRSFCSFCWSLKLSIFFNIFQSLPVEWIERTVLWSHKRHHTNSYNWIHHSSSSSKGMSYRTGQFLKDHLVNRSHSLTSSTAQGGGGSFKNRKPIGWKVECRADGLVPMRFCDVSSPPVWSTAPATKKWCQVVRSAAPVAQNHFNKPEDLMLQNANLLKKSAPGPPNSSDEHVSCTAPATETASLQILFKCPTPAIVFGNATKPSRFAHFWQGPQSLAPATRNDVWTSKRGPNPWCF